MMGHLKNRNDSNSNDGTRSDQRRRRRRFQCDQIGRFIELGQFFKACCKFFFAQIAHILRQFL